MRHVFVHPGVRYKSGARHASRLRPRQHVGKPSLLIGVYGLVQKRRLGRTYVIPLAARGLVLSGWSGEIVMRGGDGVYRREEALCLVDRLIVAVVFGMDPWRDGADNAVVGRRRVAQDVVGSVEGR